MLNDEPSDALSDFRRDLRVGPAWVAGLGLRTMSKKETGSSGQDEKPKQRKRPLDERIAVQTEWAKTVRVGCITAGVVASIWIIKNGIVELANESPWVQALKLICSVLIAQGPFAVVFYRYRRAIRKYTQEVTSRLAALERKEDPERTSSSLLEDGTDPPGALK